VSAEIGDGHTCVADERWLRAFEPRVDRIVVGKCASLGSPSAASAEGPVVGRSGRAGTYARVCELQSPAASPLRALCSISLAPSTDEVHPLHGYQRGEGPDRTAGRRTQSSAPPRRRCPLDLWHYLDVVFRRKWLIILVTVLVAAVAVGTFLAQTPPSIGPAVQILLQGDDAERRLGGSDQRTLVSTRPGSTPRSASAPRARPTSCRSPPPRPNRRKRPLRRPLRRDLRRAEARAHHRRPAGGPSVVGAEIDSLQGQID